MTSLHPAPVSAAAALDAADAAALAAAVGAGVVVRELRANAELRAASDVLSSIWGRAESPPVAPELLRAFSKSGNYVGGALLGDTVVGVTVGFSAPDAHALHSHIAGVARGMGGRSIGRAMKLHQRAWAIGRGIPVIEWTFDPLVSRNAYFNIRKLGAMPVEYLTNFYGVMPDAINGDDETDRLLVRWELLDPTVVDAAMTGHAPDATAAAGAETVAVPGDIEALRRIDPSAARRWRLDVRGRLAPLLSGGGSVVGYDRDRGYVVRPLVRPVILVDADGRMDA